MRTEGDLIAPQVVVVGSLNMDLVVRVPRFPAPGETLTGSELHTIPGGKGANQAAAASRLGARVSMVGRVGRDAFGDALNRGLQDFSAGTDHVYRDETTLTGVALISLDGSGQNQIVIIPGANARLDPAHVDAAAPLISSAAILIAELATPPATVLRAFEIAARHGVTTLWW